MANNVQCNYVYILTASCLDVASEAFFIIEALERSRECGISGQNLCRWSVGSVLPVFSQKRHPYRPLNCFILAKRERAGKSAETCRMITRHTLSPCGEFTIMPESRERQMLKRNDSVYMLDTVNPEIFVFEDYKIKYHDIFSIH